MPECLELLGYNVTVRVSGLFRAEQLLFLVVSWPKKSGPKNLHPSYLNPSPTAKTDSGEVLVRGTNRDKWDVLSGDYGKGGAGRWGERGCQGEDEMLVVLGGALGGIVCFALLKRS